MFFSLYFQILITLAALAACAVAQGAQSFASEIALIPTQYQTTAIINLLQQLYDSGALEEVSPQDVAIAASSGQVVALPALVNSYSGLGYVDPTLLSTLINSGTAPALASFAQYKPFQFLLYAQQTAVLSDSELPQLLIAFANGYNFTQAQLLAFGSGTPLATILTAAPITITPYSTQLNQFAQTLATGSVTLAQAQQSVFNVYNDILGSGISPTLALNDVQLVYQQASQNANSPDQVLANAQVIMDKFITGASNGGGGITPASFANSVQDYIQNNPSGNDSAR